MEENKKTTPEKLAEEQYPYDDSDFFEETRLERNAFLAGYNTRDADIDALIKKVVSVFDERIEDLGDYKSNQGYLRVVTQLKQSIFDVYTRWKEIGG